MLGIFGFSLCEKALSFVGWGGVFLPEYLLQSTSEHILSGFWLFLITSQILMGFFIISFDFKRMFYFLILILISAFLLISLKIQVTWLIFSLALAAVGCTGSSAIMFSELEKELQEVTKKYPKIAYLAYSEFIAAWAMAAYHLGEGLTFFHVKIIKHVPFVGSLGYYKVFAILAFLLALAVLFLYHTSEYKKRSLKPKV